METPDRNSHRIASVFSAAWWPWRLFGSVRLAFFLILVLTGLSLIGALLVQVPSEIAANTTGYAMWLGNVARPKYGSWTTILDFLRLFDVFHSPWFLGAGSLLMVNIAVCTVSRWQRFIGTVASSSIRQTETSYLSGENHAELSHLSKTCPETVNLLTAALKEHRYRVRVEESDGSVYIAADKNRYSPFGTYLNHLSIIVLILGFLMGSYLGFCNTSFAVPEGETRDVGYGTGLSLSLISFVDEYWPDSVPKDYRSHVVIHEAGREVKQGVIRVNHPMSYKGIRFYQSFFGPAPSVQVLSADGATLFSGRVPLSNLTGTGEMERPLGRLNLSQVGMTVYFIGPAYQATDPIILPGEIVLELYKTDSLIPVAQATLEQGEPQRLAGLEFTFLKPGRYSGFQVSRDPGVPLVWLASALFLLGTGAVFFFPHRELWAMAQVDSDDSSKLLLHLTSTPNIGGALEFQGIIKGLQNLFTTGKGDCDRKV